ncbi:hypothetical protein DL96DRAFT_1815940 [Flagelloscypha sp. PMI_526]|nr:hypothetical protein DL96DRAFT_1815940 [Flagelloscypha sp. PMI_526]
MSLQYLPRELYRPIVKHLSQDRKTLTVLCLSSLALRVDAELLLYENLIDLGLLSQLLLHRTMIARPRLAGLVRRYVHCEEWYPFFEVPIKEGTVQKGIEKEFWDVLVPAMLRSFTNLNSLVLRRSGGAACSHVLTECQFQLNILSWGSCNLETQLLDFLKTQTQLSEFHVLWREDMPKPARNILPTLAVFVASSFHTVAMFLPGRSIQHLTWDPDLEDAFLNEQTFGPEISKYLGLTGAFGNIVSLCIGGYFSGPSLEGLIPFIPKLVVLEVRGNTIKSEQSIKNLPALRGISFFASGLFPTDLGDRTRVVGGLFARNTKLELVFTSTAIGMQVWYENLEQWERNTSSYPPKTEEEQSEELKKQIRSMVPTRDFEYDFLDHLRFLEGTI